MVFSAAGQQSDMDPNVAVASVTFVGYAGILLGHDHWIWGAIYLTPACDGLACPIGGGVFDLACAQKEFLTAAPIRSSLKI